jgi:quercetin dioxygenase-like cupin family protein
MDLLPLQTDNRGKVWNLSHEGREYILQLTLKGRKRGGDYHHSNAHFLVLDGSIALTLPDGRHNLHHGESMTVSSETPHYYEAIEDSIVIEFRDSHNPDDRFIYQPFRELIF